MPGRLNFLHPICQSYGEGKALAAVWPRFSMDWNSPSAVLAGWANDVRRDLAFCVRKRRLSEWPHAARIRWTQRKARFAGFGDGWAEFREGKVSGFTRPPVWAGSN